MNLTIKIDDKYSIRRDQYQWILEEKTKTGLAPGGKKPKNEFSVRQTYHPTIEKVLRAVLDRKCGEKTTLGEILEEINNFHKFIEKSEVIVT